ncbi:MAG: AMP-binding protein [Betaproteobacteria bacterium]|nr:AMP-binding protein [Betaproteobacteria bacterium]
MYPNPHAPDYYALRAGFRWQVPGYYNIAWDCCGRWAQDRARFALYTEDEQGALRAWSFRDIQREANRLSNALAGLGVGRGDRVAIVMAQRAETGIAHVACYQMGAVAVPLSHLFGPDALEYRLHDSAASVAIVDASTLPRLWPLRERLPGLCHIIGVDGAREAGVLEWEPLLERASTRYGCVRTRAGEPVGATLIDWAREALGVTINEMFGQTEVNYIVGNCSSVYPVKPGSIGRPYPGHEVAVIDDEGHELPRGGAGEIAVRRNDDPVFLLEYWNNPGATRAKYIGEGDTEGGRHKGQARAAGAWARTGDTAIMDEDGYLWYQGRSDDVIKSAGYRIGPAEVENCLVKHPAVANAAVIGAPDATRGTIVKAFIVLAPGHVASAQLEASLQEHVRGRLAPYEYPRAIEFIAELPMTTTGKVQRKVLRERERRVRGEE